MRQQAPDGWLVVPDDATCERFVAASRARVARFSLTTPVEQGAFFRGLQLIVRWDGEEVEVADRSSLPLHGRCVGNVLAACVAALAAGVAPTALAEALADATVPAHRFVEVARVAGVPVYDDSMAGTPAKATAALELFRDNSIVLVSGGETRSAGGPVHATPDERSLLDAACAVATRKARRTIVFGPVAPRLLELLPGAETADDLGDAVERALAVAPEAEAVLIAPMFPVAASERERLLELVLAGSRL